MSSTPLPTPTAMLVGTAILAGLSGYMLGVASYLGFLPVPFAPRTSSTSRSSNTHSRMRRDNFDDGEESLDESVENMNLDHAPNWGNGVGADRRDGLRASISDSKEEGKGKEGEKEKQDREIVGGFIKGKENEECKLVLVVRTDLGMGKGKIAAQCSHATLACYKSLLRSDPKSPILRRWERQGQAKVALKVESEVEMHLLHAKAQSLGLTAEVIADAGRTQIASGSHTVLGVGPAPKSVVDLVTGSLKLL